MNFNRFNKSTNTHTAKFPSTPRLLKPRECAWLPRLDGLGTDSCALSMGAGPLPTLSTTAWNVSGLWVFLFELKMVQVSRFGSDKGKSKYQRRGEV